MRGGDGDWEIGVLRDGEESGLRKGDGMNRGRRR